MKQLLKRLQMSFVSRWCLVPSGTCSSAQTRAIPHLQPETSVSCLLSFTSDAVDFAANDVFTTHVSFDPNIGESEFTAAAVATEHPAEELLT